MCVLAILVASSVTASAVGPLFPVGITEPSNTDIPMERAIEIAKAALLIDLADANNYPESIEKKCNFVLLQGDDPASTAWVILFCLDAKLTDLFVYTIDSRSGEVLYRQSGSVWDVLDYYASEKGFKGYWTVEEKALFDMLFLPPSVKSHAVFPTEADLPQENAVEIAKATLMDYINVTDEYLEQFTITCSLRLYHDDPQKAAENVWMIGFALPYISGTFADQLVWQINISAADGKVLHIFDPTNSYG